MFFTLALCFLFSINQNLLAINFEKKKKQITAQNVHSIRNALFRFLRIYFLSPYLEHFIED
jgi:hypothetical protein